MKFLRYVYFIIRIRSYYEKYTFLNNNHKSFLEYFLIIVQNYDFNVRIGLPLPSFPEILNDIQIIKDDHRQEVRKLNAEIIELRNRLDSEKTRWETELIVLKDVIQEKNMVIDKLVHKSILRGES